MVCDDVKRIAYFFLDGQLGERKREDLQGHIRLCPTCDHRVSFHRRMRQFLARRLARVSAPRTLRERIHRALHQG